MITPDLSDWVVVFDLDDTLYQESDYNLSGIKAVADELEKLYRKNIKEQLLSVCEIKGDVWGRACELLALPVLVKESFLWMYRLHEPKIELYQNVADVLKEVAASAKQVAILTDGRSITQRMKLEALGLLEYPLYISEEYSSNKPEEKRFQQIMSDFDASNFVYVADNPEKDFLGSNQLGWKTIGVRDSGSNIHEQNIKGLADTHMPDVWVNQLTEVVECLC